MRALLGGELLDHGRPALLSLLALAGAVLVSWKFYKARRQPAAEIFVMSGAGLWLLVFFGRPTWGPLLVLVGAVRDLHLHRVVGALHVFLVLLAAVAMEAGWRELARRGYLALAVLLTLLVLAPMLWERATYLARNDAWATDQLIAVDAEHDVLDACMADLRRAGGRVYAGNLADWGPQFETGGNTFAAFLSMNLVPQVSATYHNIALTADLFPLFDVRRPAHYGLFNVRSVVAPANVVSGLPGFLSLRMRSGRNWIFDAPGSGYFDIVDVAASVAVDKDSFYAVNEQWVRSDWAEKRAHLWLDFGAGAPSGVARLASKAPLPASPASAGRGGEIRGERQMGNDYEAEFVISRPSFALFRMTWHPNWVAYVDGKVQKTVMLSPGFIGVAVLPGQRTILLRYEPGIWKLMIAFAGLLIVLAGMAIERRGHLVRLGFPCADDAVPVDKAKTRDSSRRPAAKDRRARHQDVP
jgi:hypothetical protein